MPWTKSKCYLLPSPDVWICHSHWVQQLRSWTLFFFHAHFYNRWHVRELEFVDQWDWMPFFNFLNSLKTRCACGFNAVQNAYTSACNLHWSTKAMWIHILCKVGHSPKSEKKWKRKPECLLHFTRNAVWESGNITINFREFLA